MRRIAPLSLALTGIVLLAAEASASVTFTGSSGSLSAEATFASSGSDLQVTLTNTSSADVLVPTDVLTAVFFSIAGNPTLTPLSAVLAPGSTVLFGTTDPGGVVGGEWAYKSASGVSSTGLGIFGPGDRFPGSNLQGPTSPDGLQYGITSAGDNPSTGNTPVTGTNALIKNSVIFTLGGLPVGFALNDIGDVVFRYGTSLSEPSFPGTPQVPEPASVLTWIGLAGLGLLVAHRRRRSTR